MAAITVTQNWEELFRDADRARLDESLVQYLRPRRWFGSKARQIRAASIRDAFRIPLSSSAAFLTLVQVDFAEGSGEHYVVPFALVPASGPAQQPAAVIADIDGAQTGVLYDALADARFCSALLDMIGRSERVQGRSGELRATALERFAERRGSGPLQAAVGTAEQSNTSVIFGGRLILKVFRRVQEGINPDLEIGRFLTERAHFGHTAPLVGTLEYQEGGVPEPTTLAILYGFVRNQGDAWKFTLEKVTQFAERVRGIAGTERLPQGHLVDLSDLPPSANAREKIGGYLDSARLLGQRTAELHLALAGGNEQAFTPEPFSLEHQKLLVQTLVEAIDRNFGQLQGRLDDLPEAVRNLGRRVLGHAETIRQRLQLMRDRPLGGTRCRCHGDYHLGQVLYTGDDFVIIDFEGEPTRSVKERRVKQSPLRDIAGMLRSFDYAAHSVALPESWGRFWYTWVSASFLNAYAATAAQGGFVPRSKDELKVLLDYFLLERALHELHYEINNRPDWVRIPLQGILRLLGEW